MTFQVSFKDLAGNEGLSFSTGNTKTVKIDTQPPNLTKVSLSSIGNDDPSLARARQKVQLDFEGSEKLRDPKVVIHGQAIPLIGVEQTWSARYSVVENDDLALNPRELEGLKLWLDASNIDGQNNTSLSNGSLVGEWKDLSGHAHHVSQTIDNRKPSLTTNLDKPYLSFDGSNDSLEADLTGHILDNPSGKDLTIFTVVRPKEGYYILSTGGQATAATGYALSFQAGNSFSTMKDNSGGRELYISDLFAPNNTHLVTHSYSETYTNIDVLVNGSSSGSEFTHYNSSTNSHQKITIGKPNNLNSYYGKFEIAEVIVISSTDAQKIMGIQYYLSKKWGLTTNVDSDGDGVSDVSDATPAGLVTQPKQVEFEITYEDEAGNQGSIITQTSDGTSVSIDTTSPIVTDYSMEVNEKSFSTSKSGDNISLSFTSSESIEQPSVTLSGRPAAIKGDGTAWTAEMLVQDDDAEGNLDVEIQFKDHAGNDYSFEGPDDSDLLAFYPLDGGALEQSGGFSGTLNGTDVTVDRSGKKGKALFFNGQSDNIQVDGSGILLNEHLSVSAWVKPHDLQSSYHTVVGLREAFNLKLQKYGQGYYLAVHIKTNGWSSGQGSTLIDMDRWYHIAATYDGEKVRLYVDGQDDGSFDASGALDMNGDLKLGSRSIDSEFFRGAIDDVRIFSRNLDALELKIWSDELQLDQTEPDLSSISLVSSNKRDNTTFAKPEDTITLSFTSTEQIQSPTIILAGDDSLSVKDMSSSKDGTSWEVVYNVTSSESERDVSFNIAYQDIAGNFGDNRTQANSRTNRIRIDTVIPELDLVSLASNNPDNSTAMAGDNVTLTVRSRKRCRRWNWSMRMTP